VYWAQVIRKVLEAEGPVEVRDLLKATGFTLGYKFLKTVVNDREILTFVENGKDLAVTVDVEKINVCQEYVLEQCK
jgi:hypothetical protein